MKKNIPLIITSILLCLILSYCSGFVKLKLPEEAYNSSAAWFTPNKNNYRQNAVNSDIIPPLQILWDKKHRSNVTDHPLTLDKFILVPFKNGELAFYDTEIGERIGDGKLVPGMEHPPVIENGILYYTANLGDKTAGAIRLNKMKRIWDKKLPNLNASPVISGSRMIVAALSGEIFCLDKNSGETLWEFKAAAGIHGNTAASADNFYFATVKGQIYCLKISTGKPVWQVELGPNIYSGPVIGNNQVFIGTTAGFFQGLDMKTGQSRWKFSTQKSIYGNAAYQDGTVYFGDSGHHLYAIDSNTGELKWRFKTKGIISHPPAVGKKFVYFGSWDKNLYVLNRYSGKEVYQHSFKKSIKSSPIIYQDRLYLHIANDRIYCMANENVNFQKGKKQ